MIVRQKCPGCGHARLSVEWRIPRQPVVLNYRFQSPGAAMRVKRRDLRMAQCFDCGLIFNIALDAAAIPYDANYENCQCCSPTFQRHMDGVADGLIARHKLQNGHILEVGCGKGNFLTVLCERAQASGVGYDTSYEGPDAALRGRVKFHRHYAKPGEVQARFDAIVCRHVVEHVGDIGDFLRELRLIAERAGQPVVLIETPAFEWINRHGCFWDIFYEHCNYFTRDCLAYLCELAGFRVVRQTLVFKGQYQLVELKVRRHPIKKIRAPGAPLRLGAFARRADVPLRRMETELHQAHASRGWAIWGAGAKGVALVNRLRRLPPRFVIDSNRAKQNCFIPASRVPVIAPGDPRINDLAVVLIANPNYAGEITLALRQGGFNRTILTA